MATQVLSGVVTPERVRQFISSLAHEMWFYGNDKIKGKATIKDNYANCVFQIGSVELTVKMRTVTNPIEL